MAMRFEPLGARAYLHSMAAQLAKMARDNGLETLACIFDMAEHEAAGLGKDPKERLSEKDSR